MTTTNTSFLNDVAVGQDLMFEYPFILSQIKGFPYSEYQSNLSRYQLAYSWFTGDALLDITTESSDEAVPAYPVRINPIYATCLKHATALFGEVTDDGRPLVIPKMIPDDEKGIKDSERVNGVLNRLWWENFGRSMMMENGILSQIYGGCAFGLRYVPWESKTRTIPIRIEMINAETIIPVPESGDKYRLKEAWIVKPIKEQDALYYGYDTSKETKFFWIEYWNSEEFKIMINGKLAVFPTLSGIEVKSQDKNPYGFVPFVYIPHIRAGTFYGMNVIDNLKGIVAEMNLRVADYGDAVTNDAHNYVAIRNVTGNPSPTRIAPGLDAINLGSNAGITGNEPEPDMFEVKKASASQPMKDLVGILTEQYRRDAFMPAIADGEDEGSQRSSLTLAMRMWPLVGHTNSERLFWTDGLDLFTNMALRMMHIKGIAGIKQKHIEMRSKQEWRPILPKDRETFMNELVNRLTANLGSIESLLEATGEVEDVEGEVKRIKEWLEFNAELKRKTSTPLQTEEEETDGDKSETKAEEKEEVLDDGGRNASESDK